MIKNLDSISPVNLTIKKYLLIIALLYFVSGCQPFDVFTSEYKDFKRLCSSEEAGRNIYEIVETQGFLSPQRISPKTCLNKLVHGSSYPAYAYCEDESYISFIAYNDHQFCVPPFKFDYRLHDEFNKKFCIVKLKKDSRVSRYGYIKNQTQLSSYSNPGVFNNTYRSVRKNETLYWDYQNEAIIASYVDYEYSKSVWWDTVVERCRDLSPEEKFWPLDYQKVIQPPPIKLENRLLSWKCNKNLCSFEFAIKNLSRTPVEAIILISYNDQSVSPYIRQSKYSLTTLEASSTKNYHQTLEIKNHTDININPKNIFLRTTGLFINPLEK